jgi:hypothetical protein
VTTELQDLAQELREGGIRLMKDADQLSNEKTAWFLRSYGQLAWDFAFWVEAQEEAEILSTEEIIRLIGLPLEAVRIHPHLSPSG